MKRAAPVWALISRAAGAAFFGALVVAATPLYAQGAAKPGRLAILSPFSPADPAFAVFEEELARLGWVKGQNLLIETAWAHGRLERLPDLANSLRDHKPDVIFAPGEQGLIAAKAAGGAPVVTVACDPLDSLIATLAAPGGSATGLSCVHSELAGKRLELLKEFVPGLTGAAVLFNPADPNKRREFGQLEMTARNLGVSVRAVETSDAEALSAAFTTMTAERVQAVVVLVDAFMIFHRGKITELARDARLASVFGFKEFVEAGGLLSYGASRGALFKRAAAYVDKILKGARPGDLPVEEPTTFELYVNRRTADALGLQIPPTILTRADEVID
jgi:putative ABC transport system substrate-binding protein